MFVVHKDHTDAKDNKLKENMANDKPSSSCTMMMSAVVLIGQTMKEAVCL